MENEIIKIIIKLNYGNELTNLISSDKTIINFPIKFNLIPTIKVLNLFNEKYFDKYMETLLENALICAIETKNKDYLNYIKENISNIKSISLNDIIFRIKTSELAIKNIIKKSSIKNNDLTFNYSLNKKTKDNNKSLFDEIQKAFIRIESISNYYLNIIFNFLSNVSYEYQEDYLYKFISTNELDNIIIKKYNLSDEDLVFLKQFIVRKILADNFVEINVSNYEEELDDLTYNNSNYEDEDYDNDRFQENDFEENDIEYEDYDIKTLEYIENCVKNNKYVLPKDNRLRFYMINNFLSYNDYTNKTYEIMTIESDKNLLKTLKKINPLYKFDLLTFE